MLIWVGMGGRNADLAMEKFELAMAICSISDREGTVSRIRDCVAADLSGTMGRGAGWPSLTLPRLRVPADEASWPRSLRGRRVAPRPEPRGTGRTALGQHHTHQQVPRSGDNMTFSDGAGATRGWLPVPGRLLGTSRTHGVTPMPS